MEENQRLNEAEEFKQLNHLFARAFISMLLDARKEHGQAADFIKIPIDPDAVNYSIQVQELFQEDTHEHSVKICIVKAGYITH